MWQTVTEQGIGLTTLWDEPSLEASIQLRAYR